MDFTPFPKVPRLKRPMVVTEKIDGTNACVAIRPLGDTEDTRELTYWCGGQMTTCYFHDGQWFGLWAGSRNRWITPGKTTDNYGFAQWVLENTPELVKLGPGRHFGEWYGRGIQRGYGLTERRFALFAVHRWYTPYCGVDLPPLTAKLAPSCCDVVPLLYQGDFNTSRIEDIMYGLSKAGSEAAFGYMHPEGIMVFHAASGQTFKRTFEHDEQGKEAA